MNDATSWYLNPGLRLCDILLDCDQAPHFSPCKHPPRSLRFLLPLHVTGGANCEQIFKQLLALSSGIFYLFSKIQLPLRTGCFSSFLLSFLSGIWSFLTATANRWSSLTDGSICGTPPPPVGATQMVQSTSRVSDQGAVINHHHNFLVPGWQWHITSD